MRFKEGDIVKDRKTKQLGIIVAPYEGNLWDWEVYAIKSPFVFGHVWQDCFEEQDLIHYEWKDYPQIPETFFQRVKFALRLIFKKEFILEKDDE